MNLRAHGARRQQAQRMACGEQIGRREPCNEQNGIRKQERVDQPGVF